MYKKIEELAGNQMVQDVKNESLLRHVPFETEGMKRAQKALRENLMGK